MTRVQGRCVYCIDFRLARLSRSNLFRITISSMIPFFVVDRRMSLNILKTSLVAQPHLTFGLMTHACVTPNFLRLFSRFPCDLQGCWLRKTKGCTGCDDSERACSLGQSMQERIVRMCDSGIFEKTSKDLSYNQLFAVYKEARADYGVMKDVLWDSKQTI